MCLYKKIEIFLKTQQEEEIENFTPKYYTLQSSLQIQHSAILDDENSHALLFTSDCTCCEGNYQNFLHSVCQLFITAEYKFTIHSIRIISDFERQCSFYKY